MNEAQPRYEWIEHTADVAVRARDKSLADAFAASAEAMFDLITGGASIKGRKPLSIKVKAIDQEGLLVGFLSELVRIFDTDQVVMSDFEVNIEGPERLSARCKSEPFDENRHGEGLAVKGVSYHMLEITTDSDSGATEVQVLFDV
jgi:SHS2 domain-containing protein